MKKNNVIILTHGWTGSSVFTALIGSGGYWSGDQTFEKADYNTHENIELVELNERLLTDLGFSDDREHQLLDLKTLQDLEKKAEHIDLAPYRDFVNRCLAHQPFIWKDPRLTWTIRIWAKLLPLDKVDFVILTRETQQAWIASNLRRHIQSLGFTRKYNQAITASLKQFLTRTEKSYIEFEFEDLQLEPEQTIKRLNDFLNTRLTMEHLTAVYRLPLYKKSKNWKDAVKALAIYLKNYRYRDQRLSSN